MAKIVQAALSGSASVAGTGTPAGGATIEAEAAAQWNASRSESMAQLTKRIPTIQLLRDNLYRACEAYANGAIGREAYAAILSRFDRMMITMLLAETAAGNFGTAAILTGNASASAASEASAGPAGRAAVAEAQYRDARMDYEAQVRRVEELKVQKTQADKRLADKRAASQDFTAEQQEVNALEAKIAAEEKIEASAKANMDAADAARKDAQAAAKAGGALAAARGQSATSAGGFFESPAVAAMQAARANAEVIARMQRSYLNDPPLHTMMMMCFAELARPEPIGWDLRKDCNKFMDTMLSERGLELVRESSIAPQRMELGNDRLVVLGTALQGLLATGKATPEAVRALVAAANANGGTAGGNTATPSAKKPATAKPAPPSTIE